MTKRLDYNYNKITTRPNYRRSGQDISVRALQLRHYKLTTAQSDLILSGTINILIAELIKNVSLMDENDRARFRYSLEFESIIE